MSRRIDDLPPELFYRIFVVVASSIQDQGSEAAPPCTNISHTCSRWRAVALACPELWSTCLPRISREWTELCLSRTPKSSFTFFLHSQNTDKRYRNAMTVMAPHLSRAHTVDIALVQHVLHDEDNPTIPDLLVLLANSSWRSLKNLSFNISCHDGGHCIPVRLPAQLFTEQSLSSTSHSTGNLRVLNLCNAQAWGNLSEMFAFLESVPRLEELSYEITDVGESGHDLEATPFRSPRSVDLPCLRSLKLHCEWIDTIVIFATLRAPSLIHLSISCHEWDITYTLLPTYSWLVREAFHHHFAPAVRAGVHYDHVQFMDHKISGCCTVVCEAPADTEVLGDASCNLPSISIDIPYGFGEGDTHLFRSAADLFLTLPIFTCAPILSPGSWLSLQYSNLYHNYTSVRSLQLRGMSSTASLRSAFRLGGAIFFPELSHVSVSCYLNENSRPKVVIDLAKVLSRSAHATTGTFKCLTINCHLWEDELAEVQRHLGVDRVEYRPHAWMGANLH